ncbi:hypothetical protein VNO78_25155 [Psophocarpus tetragonolobus]|uniref:C2 domain-containing protein n=1 Tax=Psophocarpus tetragonolobus TaxID=3891 RepID=A0AAN9S8Z4_PSOTE
MGSVSSPDVMYGSTFRVEVLYVAIRGTMFASGDILANEFYTEHHDERNDGIKAQGEGWMPTVALIEGSKLATVDSKAFCDPYVVFTCNGKTRTISIKFRKSDPSWNEIFEFDVMYDLLLCWKWKFMILMDRLLALASQSKLHLKIFLNNIRGSAFPEKLEGRKE